jgi:hypothetical protein
LRLQAEGPYEPGTIALVHSDDETVVLAPTPGMKVSKRLSPVHPASGIGIIIAVEPTDHPYGPIVHVLWSSEPMLFTLPKGVAVVTGWDAEA